MEKNKINNTTEKLKKLVKARKTPVVTYEHGIKYTSRKSSSGGFSSESYSGDFYE